MSLKKSTTHSDLRLRRAHFKVGNALWWFCQRCFKWPYGWVHLYMTSIRVLSTVGWS